MTYNFNDLDAMLIVAEIGGYGKNLKDLPDAEKIAIFLDQDLWKAVARAAKLGAHKETSTVNTLEEADKMLFADHPEEIEQAWFMMARAFLTAVLFKDGAHIMALATAIGLKVMESAPKKLYDQR